MFENCIIKYEKKDDATTCIKITYPTNEDGLTFSKAVPIDEENTDYQNILQWVADGNTIQEDD
ncbi:hypothetical protein [uncultured Mediterranean phage uvMED]|nr:hypothetical protein [uncultured Mediterranean phage uvMED]BAR37066.1 hypothetical protein [uncultured Mediterranean phage uvMED]